MRTIRTIYPPVSWLSLLLAMTVAVTTPILFLRIQDVQHHQNDALDSIICRAEHVVRTSSGLTLKQRRQAIRFYEQSIHDAHLKPCGR